MIEALKKQEEKANELIANEKAKGNTDGPTPAPAKDAIVDPPPAAPSEEETVLKTEHDKLQQAHDVLKGKYNTEVPRLTGELNELRTQVAQSANLMTQLSQENAELKAKPPEAPAVVLSEEEENRLKEAYGDDYLKDMRAIIGGVMKPVTEKLADIETASVKSAQDAHDSVQSTYLSDIGKLTRDIGFPNMELVRTSAEFAEFLSGHTETHSGKTLAELIVEADEKKDAHLVATFYQAFKDFQKPAPATTPVKGNGKKERFIAPNASSTAKLGAAPAAPKRIFTGAEIAKHHNDYRAGVYNGKPEEWKKLETEMNSAIAAQEVQP